MHNGLRLFDMSFALDPYSEYMQMGDALSACQSTALRMNALCDLAATEI
jgi:hypothetical protein